MQAGVDDDRYHKPPALDPESAGRMRQLRQSQGFATVAAFARHIDVSHTRWSNVEYGGAVSRELAARLRGMVPGLTYEWIWHGEIELLPPELQKKLAAEPR